VNKQPLLITFDPVSELARALADADAQVVIDSEGVRYTVAREDAFARYDPEAVLRALRESCGALRGVATDALQEDLAGQCEQVSGGRTRKVDDV
jgi:hypothetical protein